MPDVLKLRVLHVRRNHGMLRWGVRVAWERAALFVLIVVVVAVLFTHKVLRAFVFVCAAILRDLSV